MKPELLCLVLTSVFLGADLRAAPPVVSNVRASQIAGTKNVEILYDVSDADGDALTIGMQVSGDAGQTYTIPTTALSGHVGLGVAAGTNRRIVWNAGADWNGQLVSTAKARITASDATTPAPPPGMVYIPAGSFQMGDNFNEIGSNALPVHNVQVDGFFMDKFEVKKELWQSVQTWAQGNGYSITAGSYSANGHPVQSVSWYECVKWCNARSEKEGLTPCYYNDDAQTSVYRIGGVAITNSQVKWTANGYRLPTEAQWEKAARGASTGLRYPWGNTILGSQANYLGSGDVSEALSVGTTPVGYYDGNQLPAGVEMANGYGLFDMGGNVREWCWDWYASQFYADPSALNNPVGPFTGDSQAFRNALPARVIRGGSWKYAADRLRCAYRELGHATGDEYSTSTYSSGWIGFRCVRKAP